MSLPFIHIDAPMYIFWCLAGNLASVITTGWGFAQIAIGELPDPNTAGAWSFYGVLIIAIIVLFSTFVISARWFFGYWLKKQEEMVRRQEISEEKMIQALDGHTTSNHAVASNLATNNHLTSKQIEWFERFAAESMKLNFPGRRPKP